MTGRLQDKVVVILGASEEGSMGAATARRFAREGAKLVLAARRLDKVEPIARALGGIAVACDITKEADIEALAAAAVKAYGHIDVAINYAGVDAASTVADVSYEMLLNSCLVHFIGPTLFFKHMARHMPRGGSLVTASSLTALVAPPGLAAYAGAKKASDQMVRIAAYEYGAQGIRVNSLVPGFTRTAMTEGYFGLPTLEGAFIREIPLGRLVTIEDIANAALWLVSDECAVTGIALDVTGGQSTRRTPTNEELMR